MKTINSLSLMLVVAVLLSIIGPAPAFSQMKDMPNNDHRGGHGQMMNMGHMDSLYDMMGMCMEHADMLGLSDEQIRKMKPVHSDMQKKQARFQADVKIAEIELMEIMDVKDFDLEKAGFAVKKIAEIKTAHQLEMLKAMKDMRTVVTDEQFKKMHTLMPGNMCDIKPAKKMNKK